MAKLLDEHAPQPARRGTLALCRLCNLPAVSHFDSDGKFLGCLQADKDTIFDLVGYSSERLRSNADTASPTSSKAKMLRHFCVKEVNLKALKSELSEPRYNILKAIIDAGPVGALTRDIRHVTGLSNFQIQDPLRWLRSKQFIVSTEI